MKNSWLIISISLLCFLGIGVGIVLYKTFIRKTDMQKTSEWLMHVKEITANKNTGKFNATDKAGIPVTFEWTVTNVKSPKFSKLMNEICDVVVQAFTPVEASFLKAHHEQHEEYCASFEPIFKTGPVAQDWQIFKQALNTSDWSIVEEKMHSILRGIQTMDYSNFGVEDVHIFVTVKDAKTQKLLGYITFHITPNFPYGDVKSTGIGLLPTEQNRGLGKLLMSSIFKIIPNVKRIPLSTRVTNEKAFNAYKNWGFVFDDNPIAEPYMPINRKQWAYLKYEADKSDVLQKTAAMLKIIEAIKSTVIDLTHRFIESMPVHSYDKPSSIKKVRNLDKNKYNDWQLTSGMHVGTHIDGPGHLTNSEKLLSDYQVDRFVGRGFLVDARNKSISKDLLTNMPEEDGLIVLILTESDKNFGTKEYFTEHPVIPADFADELVKRKVKMIGIDFFSPDKYPFPVHQILFKNDILIIENLTNLGSLIGLNNFKVVALPLKTETDSALARVVAIA